MSTAFSFPCRHALVLVTLTLASTTQAQAFAELERRLLDHPDLAALRFETESAREASDAELGLPDPVVAIGVSNFPVFDPAFDRYLPTSKTLGIRQEIPNRSQRQALASTARAGAERSDALHAMRHADLRARLVVALVERERIDTQRALLAQQIERLAELAEVVESEIDAGRPQAPRLATMDVRQVQLEVALAGLDEEAAVVEAQLVALVGVAATTPPPEQAAVGWDDDPDALYAARVALADVDQAAARVAGAQAAWRPDWNVELTYQQRDAGRGGTFDGEDWITGRVGFSVPLWAGRSQAPRLRAASAGREAAHSRYAAAVRQGAADFAAQRASLARAQRSLGLIEREITALSSQIESQRVLYESGSGDYGSIIEGQIELLERQRQQAQERAREKRAIALMHRLVVTP